MAKWNTSETGILRKKVIPENHEDLLVFGYACKLFRDDDKAKYIDQGKHLIPWMADETLRIDRYDCRGALSDLNSYEASKEGYDATRWLGLSESERKIEQLCDEERYYALHSNEEEEEMYKEEELKRLEQKTNEFAYSYDVPQDPQSQQSTNAPTCEEEDKEYVPRPELDVPVDIAIPKTQKENARIEKTALFVSKQGLQMEILIKTKQANNPQFSFLNQTDPLYKYYKHVLNALKSGTYRVESISEEEEKKNAVEQETNEDHYLHPSLLQTSVQAATLPAIPTVTYKPTADCAYSQLVNRIQGSQNDAVGGATVTAPNPKTDGELEQGVVTAPQTQLTYEQQQQQYYQYYYAMQYYEYYKQLVQQFHSMGGTDGQTIPPLIQEQIHNQATAFAQMAYTQYVQQSSNNPYSQIVSNVSQLKENVYPSVTANISDTGQPVRDITKAPIIYSQTEPDSVQSYQPNVPNCQHPQQAVAAIQEETVKKPVEAEKQKATNSLLPLVHYGSDSEIEENDENNEQDVEYKIPPDETKLVIDKMASYVSKNGRDFESIVKCKGDPRFEFLKEDHEYHYYYRQKIKEYGGIKEAEEKKDTSKVVAVPNGTQAAKLKDKKIITPVCFSIKKPKEEMPKDIKSALPIEESDEEDVDPQQQQQQQQKKPEDIPNISKDKDITSMKPNDSLHPPNPSSSANNNSNNNNNNNNSSNSNVISKDNVTSHREIDIPSRSATPPPKEKHNSPEKKNESVDTDDPILEMIDLTDDLEEKKDARRAEDRIKDKLAAAAREKLASVSKDRALQMERKKKAAAFLKLKSVESDKAKTATPRKEEKEKVPDEDKVLVISDSDNKSENVKERNHRRSRSKTKEKHSKKEEDSDSDVSEVRSHKKSSKKKKSHHKRKRSKSRHRSRTHYKKVKKRRRRSESHHESSSSDD